MVKHFHTLASHALELNGCLCRHLVRLQFQLEPQREIQQVQQVLNELQKMVRDMQVELKTNTPVTKS